MRKIHSKKLSNQPMHFFEDFEKRQKARNRLPIGLAMLMPFILLTLTFGFTFFVVAVSLKAYHVFHSVNFELFSRSGQQVTTSIVMIFTFSFFIGVTTAIPFGNFLLWMVPLIRKKLNATGEGVPSVSYADAVTTAKQMILYVALPSFIFLLIGIWAPWE